MGRLVAIPQRTELNVKTERQMRKYRRRPSALTIHPAMGSTMAFDTRYDVNTQVLSLLLAPNPPAMCGSATLAMLVSRTSMKAASETTPAISQGLCAGFHSSSIFSGSSVNGVPRQLL